MVHVDDFINDFTKDKYARWFFMLHRLPAFMQADFAYWMDKYKLFCIFKGKKYRCTGASRMGDVWLTPDFDREVGYELRVDVDECSDWTQE